MAVRLKMKSGVKGAIKGVARSKGGDFFFFGVSFFFSGWERSFEKFVRGFYGCFRLAEY